MLREIHESSPKWLQPYLEQAYYSLPHNTHPRVYESEFIDAFFEGEEEYEGYISELSGDIPELIVEGVERFNSLTGSETSWGGISRKAGERYYALVRRNKPETIVETGVCNGSSTLFLLYALHQNERGNLYSIDYPVYADEELPEFRKNVKTSNYSAIPADKEPGWIIPEELRDRWELHTGRSQRVLPAIVQELEGFDIFIHDSEHSFPCMMFEYELAWEWMSEDGLLISDDTHFNDAFDVFVESREAESGNITRTVKHASREEDYDLH